MNKIISLQFLRAFACLFVLLAHVLQKFNSRPFGNFISGAYGVDLFFILSGFLIYLTTKNDENWKVFAIKRVFRIFPMYWFCLLLYFFWFTAYLDKSYTTLYCFKNFLMLPWSGPVNSHNLIIGVAWSTVYEVYFYFVFLILITFKIPKKYIMGVLFLLLLIFKAIYGINLFNLKENEIFQFLYSLAGYSHILPFVLGVSLAILFNNPNRFRFIVDFKFKQVIFICLHLIYIIILLNKYNQIFSYLISLLIFIMWLNIDLIWHVNYKSVVSKFFIKMGDISFSIYLIHILVIDILVYYFNVTNLFLTTILAFVISIGISFITFNYVETPFIKLSRTIVRSKTNSNNNK